MDKLKAQTLRCEFYDCSRLTAGARFDADELINDNFVFHVLTS